MKAIVLTTNTSSTFLRGLGMSVQSPMMCMYVTPTKVYDFQVFDLMVQDNKIIEYVKTKNGLMILIDNSDINTNIINRINQIIKEVPDIPTLIKIENVNANDNSKIAKMFGNFGNKLNIKLFYNGYEAVNPINGQNINYEAQAWFNDAITKKRIVKEVKETKITSRTILAKDMATKLVNCTLELELWDHFGRLKIVDYSLGTYGYENTIDPKGWLCTNWKKYKQSIGHGHLWNYTLTRFWANILYNIQGKHNYKSFDELYDNNSPIHDGKFFQYYYSNEVLFSDKARTSWIPPNLLVTP